MQLQTPTQTQSDKNRVLDKAARQSPNFFESDKMLRHFIQKNASAEAWAQMLPYWTKLGAEAAGQMNELSYWADKKTPELVKRNHYGETLNQIVFHPAYHTLTDIAIQSGMFSIKWQPDNRTRFGSELHRLGFINAFLFGMTEAGLLCPLCMTDGVARLIDRYCESDDKQRLLAHIYTHRLEDFYTGAMFLTEKAGGSDVGANLVSATHWQDNYYLLNGEKWFCSNANAEIIFALARTNPEVKGTKGLSIFLIEKQRPDGSPNTMDVVRLKDKLGVRSMASAECILTNTVGKRIGEEGEGFKIMTDMINLSRLYNAIGSISGARRALIEAYQHLSFRTTFGRNALDHALVREKLAELTALYQAEFYLTWRTVQSLDLTDHGNTREAELVRLLTPMVKRSSAAQVVYIVRECMELVGGLGYIEDGVIPRLMRDCMVLPIWEGAGNIMLLDMLRASFKSKGFSFLCEDLQATFAQHGGQHQAALTGLLQQIVLLAKQLGGVDQETLETTAKDLFGTLTRLYQIGLLMQQRDSESQTWVDPALGWLIRNLQPASLQLRQAPDRASIEAMMAWAF
ncbi:MAG TPA: acyl-CoA dehydrogenase [Microscillaceae bacterium]|nr:acyl-CoA dehydrogenase [Microscillaceae bacterium]